MSRKKERQHTSKQQKEHLKPQKGIWLKRLISTSRLEVLIAALALIFGLISWKHSSPLGWAQFWSTFTHAKIFVDLENHFFFYDYDKWWGEGALSESNYYFNDSVGQDSTDGLTFFMANEIHEYGYERGSDRRAAPDADMEYFFLLLPDSRNRTWWTPGAGTYLVVQVAPNMKMNKYGMNNSLVNYFSQSGKYELLKSGGIPPIAMGNSNLQDVSFYELRRVRNRSDLSVTQVPRFRDTLIDSSRPTPLSGYLLPVDPIPLVSDGNDRQGSDLRVCMIAFYHEQTFVSLTLYADPTVYDRALESILKPIYESLTFY